MLREMNYGCLDEHNKQYYKKNRILAHQQITLPTFPPLVEQERPGDLNPQSNPSRWSTREVSGLGEVEEVWWVMLGESWPRGWEVCGNWSMVRRVTIWTSQGSSPVTFHCGCTAPVCGSGNRWVSERLKGCTGYWASEWKMTNYNTYTSPKAIPN